MSTVARISATVAMLLAAHLSVAQAAEGMLRVYDLRTEHMSDPLGIDAERPRFSWKIADGAHVSGERQTAYRILVATTADKLASGRADVWDSGVVPSDQSHLVEYGGRALRSGDDCYWKVQVCDRDGKRSEWSPAARFSTGLFSRSEWRGEWIKHPSAPPDRHIWFRRELKLNARPATTFAYVATNGYHELYVNGRKADDRLLAPAVACIDKRVFYVTYDITPLLQKGDNVVAVWWGAGWTRNNYFAPRTEGALLVQVDGRTDRGTRFGLCTDGTWRCEESSSRYVGRFQFMDMGGEMVDGRRVDDRWNAVGFDDSRWARAAAANPTKGGEWPTLTAQTTDRSRIVETIEPKEITAEAGGWRVDMGKSFTGFLEARFDGLQAGDTAVIRISGRADVLEDHRQRHCYIARGQDGETFVNRFNFFAGRYIHFKGLRQKPALSDIRGLAVSSAGERTGYFDCSDTLFNRIYRTDRWTYEMCHTEGVVTDCPNRERLGYGAEGAYLTAWGLGLPCFASAAYYLKNLRDWGDVQADDGRMNYVAPQISDMWGNALGGSAPLNIALELYNACGDRKALETAVETGRRWLDYLLRHLDGEGLLTPYDTEHGHFLGDWLRPGHEREHGGENALFFNNCALAMALDHHIRILEALGQGDRAAPYRQSLQRLRENLHRKYYNPDVHSYLDGDQVRTVFALYAGVVPEGLQPAALKHLERDMTDSDCHPYFNIGSFSRYPCFKVMLAHRQFDEIVCGILSRTTWPGYGYFLLYGETTWPETWEIDHDRNSSGIHTGYTGVSAWFIKGLAGVEPEEPGYRRVGIRPRVVGRLRYAKAGVETPYGLVESGWERTEGGVRFDITVPVGAVARIYLPENLSGITEGGVPLSQADGLSIEVGAGKYRFEGKTK
ncbi:MAG: glycoside hydrolase family 78 protein [Rikenellaceae bacterium]|jgi:alpha-L-rhamnosidase|nr:glycoside hydrolase family 78 protein [Rikenellaceae bacterium]